MVDQYKDLFSGPTVLMAENRATAKENVQEAFRPPSGWLWGSFGAILGRAWRWKKKVQIVCLRMDSSRRVNSYCLRGIG